MPLDPPLTLYALASAPGRAGVAVVRLSGPKAAEALTLFCRPATLPPPRLASLREIVDPPSGELIDRALVLFFPAPHSFTGEDVAEFHLHGGRAVLAALFAAFERAGGFSPAPPGAFSRRAFENGKLDLTQAEAIADLVDAETAAQRKQALRQMEGTLATLYKDWAARLTHALALTEASLDFSDDDLPVDLLDQSRADLAALAETISSHLHDSKRGERLRDGFLVTLIGPPNAGKSSLMNALARQDIAIVSATPGTTRDVLEVRLDLGGYPVLLADTAGLRDSLDALETEGVRRALDRAQGADLKLLVLDAAALPPADDTVFSLIDDDTLILLNKADLFGAVLPPLPTLLAGRDALYCSARAFANEEAALRPFLQKLLSEIERRYGVQEAPALTRARHREALQDCAAALTRARAATDTELFAEDLRLALRALGRITGQVDVESLLDRIFSTFCIGK